MIDESTTFNLRKIGKYDAEVLTALQLAGQHSKKINEIIDILQGSGGGIKGEKGDTGETGPQGIQGIQGIKGDKGDKGDTGEIGPQGIQGEIGPQGIQGEPGTGGSGQSGDYSIDSKPINPTIYDDEFDNGVIDSKWTIVNQSSSIISEGSIYPDALTIDMTSVSANAVTVLQPIPTGNLEIVGKCRIEANMDLAGSAYSGLCLKGSLLPTDPTHAIHLRVDAALWMTVRSIRMATQVNTQTFGVKWTVPFPDNLYVKYTRIGTAWTMAISSNGVSWSYFEHTGVNGLNFTPTHFGILGYKGLDPYPSWAKARAHFDWIRVKFL